MTTFVILIVIGMVVYLLVGAPGATGTQRRYPSGAIGYRHMPVNRTAAHQR